MAAITATSSTTLGSLTVSAAATIVQRPGSTLTALQSGSAVLKWTAAIHGYPYLLTDAPSGCAVDAWDGLDWTQDLQGLFVDLQNEQSINPWDPFTRGGKLTLRIAPDASDTFGIDTHRKTAGDETILADTTGIDDTPITVLSTSAFASSGTVYIGTEAIAYTGKTGTTFTGCTRGKYAPFTVDGGTTSRFGQRHEVTTDPNAIKLQPVVSEQPRVWLGKWLGLWMHRWDESNQLLNTRANAQLVYAGRIVEISDDPSSGCTVVECEHVLDYVKRAVIGPDWTARIKEGMFLEDGMEFNMSDSSDANATSQSATPLTVVPSGATAPYEINEGFYNHDDLCTAINAWLAQAKTDGDLDGVYNLALGPYGTANRPTRTYFSYKITGTGPTVHFKLTYPRHVSDFFGNLQIGFAGDHATLTQHADSLDGVDYDRVSERTPPRNGFIPNDVNIQSIIEFEDERGTFVDQAGDLPGEVVSSGGGDIGLIMINNQAIFGGLKIGSRFSSAVPITSIRLAGQQRGASLYDFIKSSTATVDDPDGAPTVKQILFYQDSTANILKKIFYTTNGEGYNHATYDVLPMQLGINIPGELLGDDFEASCDALPGSDATYTLVVEKKVKLADLFTSELVFRWAFLRWVDEHLELCNWRTPTTGTALTESNKASPVGTQDDQRTASMLTDEWQRTTIKVDYDRDVNALDFGGGFRSSLTLIDRVAVDDAGGAERPITLQLRGTYGIDGVDELKNQFKSTATLFTRPVRRQTRTIDSRFFEGYAVGDCVLVTDEFARDPDTGQRGVAARPGIITRHAWSPGGAGPNGSVGDIHGEVDVMFLDLLRVAQYVPTAQLDDTATNSGYVIATKIATCYAHKFSESSESVDASYFTTGRKIRFIEIDPVDPASPSTHDDTVASQTGNTITLTTGFAAFSNTKRYKIVFDTYGDSIAAQQAGFVYQADDADGMIEDTRVPFQYTNPPLIRGTANSASDLIELPANNTFGDGVGRDVGTDVSTNRLINNLLDYKCTLSQPFLGATELSGNGVSGTWRLVECCPIWLTAETNNNQHTRRLTVAPFMKSSVALSTANVRVSVSRTRPTGTSYDDVDLGALVASATFTTTSSTYATATAQELTLTGLKSQSGMAYLLIECSSLARTRGLAICQESERITFE